MRMTERKREGERKTVRKREKRKSERKREKERRERGGNGRERI